MSETKKLIAELDQKVEQLLKNVREQHDKLESKKNKVVELKEQLAEQESEINALKTENKTLKEAPVTTENDSEEMKAKIGELVREIDKCISLLKV